MLLTTLLALAMAAPLQEAPRADSRARDLRLTAAEVQALQGLTRRGLGTSSSTLGGSFTTGAANGGMVITPGFAPGVYRIVLDDPGTGWQESVILGVPQVQVPGPAPMLVMFHGHDVSEWDAYVNGNALFEEARSRGWYVLSPLGAHQVNYGIPYAQTNIEYALTLFTDELPIDMDRIYGAGFSMGGNTLMSYASRHHDLDKPRFAAVANHTGTVSVAFTYHNSTNTAVFEHPLLFGGSPAKVPFLYSQSSAIDIDSMTSQVDPDTDLARNLANTTVVSFYADNDPLTNAVFACQTLFNWLAVIPGVDSTLTTAPSTIHAWSTIDEVALCNTLSAKALQTPTDGIHRVLADREDNWFHFYVRQDAAGQFTPFRWNYEPVANRLTIDETENLASLDVRTDSIGLDTASNLEIIMSSSDGGAEEMTLTGYTSQPQEVKRGGVVTTAWAWDSQTETLTLFEADPSLALTWLIQP